MEDSGGDRLLEMYKLGAADAENAEEKIASANSVGRFMGILQTLKYFNTHNDVIKYATIYRIKESKEYKKMGMTWEEFCESVGESKKTIDTKLRDAGPLFEAFKSDSERLVGVQFNQVRYLGRKITAEGANIDGNAIVVDGMRVELDTENKDEIKSLIQAMKEREKAEREALKNQLEKEKKDRDKIIKEATKGLEAEKDALVKELTAAKSKLPDLDVPERVEEAVKVLTEEAFAFVASCRRLMQAEPEALKDRKVQGNIYGIFDTIETSFQDLRMAFDDMTRTDSQL